MNSAPENPTGEFVARFWPRDGDMPKHRRLHRAFADAISAGFWPAGARLPTEAELVAASPCSLGTIQRALRSLAQDGLIERRRGSGSVVAAGGGRLSDPWHMRFIDPGGAQDKTQDTAQQGTRSYLPLKTRVLSRDLITGSGRWSGPLGQGDARVLKIDRLFTVDGRFDVYSEFYALESRFPEGLALPEDSLSGLNFKQHLAERYRLPVSRVQQSLRFAVPPAHIRDRLRPAPCAPLGQPPQPIPVLNVLAHSAEGEAVYYQDFHLPLAEAELDLGTLTRM